MSPINVTSYHDRLGKAVRLSLHFFVFQFWLLTKSPCVISLLGVHYFYTLFPSKSLPKYSRKLVWYGWSWKCLSSSRNLMVSPTWLLKRMVLGCCLWQAAGTKNHLQFIYNPHSNIHLGTVWNLRGLNDKYIQLTMLWIELIHRRNISEAIKVERRSMCSRRRTSQRVWKLSNSGENFCLPIDDNL